MSLGSFWKIYFVLLHPRLNKHDAELLSTPQVVEARAMLLHGLQVQAKQEPGGGFRRASSFKDDASSSSEQLSTPRMPTSPTKAWLPLENVALQQNKYFDMEKAFYLDFGG
ncbi:hypothetical protein HPP92_008086 [Vanilla planifolia]|uniref:Uncharacterized protein n=1 Tax=Vanilla planifolia TaxID=51239 RepID=A0A835R5D5_VANPL|nr:hypothetical protein HPP92_008086 [Vanilla planifolia]